MLTCPITLTSPDGQKSLDVEAIVDTGTGFSVIPADLLYELGIEPTDKRLFETQEGQLIEMDLGEVRVSINGIDWHNLVVFGPTGSQPRLGRITLNIFQLAVDPDGSKLVHKPARLPQGPRREVRSSPIQP